MIMDRSAERREAMTRSMADDKGSLRSHNDGYLQELMRLLIEDIDDPAGSEIDESSLAFSRCRTDETATPKLNRAP
jgi:hypothetical protein